MTGNIVISNAIRWLNGYFDFSRLDVFIGAEKSRGGLQESLVIVLLGNALSFLVMSIAFMLNTFLLGAALPSMGNVLVVFLAGYTMVFYATSWLIYVFARLLDGKGSFNEQAYMMAAFNFCSNIVSAPVALLVLVLAANPLVALFQLAAMLLGVYNMYIFYRTVRSLHSLSALRALAVLALTVIALWIVFTAVLGRAA